MRIVETGARIVSNCVGWMGGLIARSEEGVRGAMKQSGTRPVRADERHSPFILSEPGAGQGQESREEGGG